MTRDLVVHVGPSARARGGVARVIALLVESSLADRYHVFTVESVGSSRTLAWASFPFALVRVAWLTWMRRAALFHLHTASRGSFLRKSLLSRVVLAGGGRYAVHLHGGGFTEYHRTASPGTKRAVVRYFEQAAAVFVVSEDLAAFVRDVIGVEDPVVVANPVVMPVRPTHGMDSGRVVTVGHLGPLKGTDVLIEAMERVWTNVKDASLQLVGDGLSRELLARTEAGVLSGRIAVRDWMAPAELEREMATCAIFALPSRAEGMPLSLLEAMAMGLACVVTPVGGMPEVVEDGLTGVIVQPGDAAALADALEALLSDHELRRSLGAAARERVRERSVECAADVIAGTYRRIGVSGAEGGSG